jgi:hypothetical protein
VAQAERRASSRLAPLAVHDHEDSPELREEIKTAIKDTEAAAV